MTWEQIKSPKKPMVSIDGYQRTPEVENELKHQNLNGYSLMN